MWPAGCGHRLRKRGDSQSGRGAPSAVPRFETGSANHRPAGGDAPRGASLTQPGWSTDLLVPGLLISWLLVSRLLISWLLVS
ncbi:unnamed protein product [Merluccius merluccius]